VAERLIEQQLGDIRILGYSVAGEESVVAAPELNVCFDVGKAPADILAIDNVLLTHGHMDHSAGLAYYFSQRNFVGNAPGRVAAPRSLVQPIRDLLKVWGRIEGHVTPAKVVGLSPGEVLPIRRGLVAQAFAINHGVDALGYCVVDIRRKLRPELADKSGPELVELKKRGIEIEHELRVPLIAYCGDTAEGDWMQLDEVRRAKVLVLECTFFEPDHVRRAREGYHLHVRDVARMLDKLDNAYVLLTHVTRRTGVREAKRALTKMIGEEGMARVRFLMDGRRYRRRRPERMAEPPAGRRESGAVKE